MEGMVGMGWDKEASFIFLNGRVIDFDWGWG
jgi:hypothetical protein